MKVPLNYQITEFDCCSTYFVNVFSYLYKRSKINPEILKKIYYYTLDLFNYEGTSKLAVKKLIDWLNENIPITCKYSEKRKC